MANKINNNHANNNMQNEVFIKLNSIESVKKFVHITSMCDFDIDLCIGRYIVDAKSIMGIFSLDLSEKIKLTAHTNDATKFFDSISDYIVS